MISPEQTLLHLTSQGTKVRTLQTNQVGKFINQTQQALTNVNKFGLLHYSIPKTLDMMREEDRTFFIQVDYEDAEEPSVQFEVVLPLMDYYKITVDTPTQYTNLGEDRLFDNQACFTEILQTCINWGIQKYRSPDLPATGARARANRLGCVVRADERGALQFYFGYRGNTHLVTPTENSTASGPYEGLGANSFVVKPNTGCPWPINRAETPNVNHRWLRVMAQADNRYSWIDTEGIPRTDRFPRAQFQTDEELRQIYAINRVSFKGVSKRLMNMIGATVPNFSFTHRASEKAVDKATGALNEANTRTIERGRICLVDYKIQSFNQQGQPIVGKATDPGSNIIQLSMYTTPNLFPPSFLFLNLLAQGTKTRVLGHESERGGWAVPCASNEFVSSHDNYPWNTEPPAGALAEYSFYQVRNMPMLLNLQKPELAKEVAKGGGTQTSVFFQDVGGVPGSMFDPKVPYPEVNAFDGDANHPRYPGITVKSEDNFSLAINTDLATIENPVPAGAPSGTQPVKDMAKQFKFGSQMIHYGDLEFVEAPAMSLPRKRFGNGVVSAAPTFTVSMITPMYIYTDVPNATVQTLDVQLMWGDTAQNVDDTASEPCQFSLIASQ